MPIVWVGKLQRRDQGLIAFDQAVIDRGIEQLPGPRKLLGKRGPGSEQCRRPFVVDLLCPAGPEEAGACEPDDEITKRSRIQNIRIKESDESYRSVAHSQFLRFRG